MPTYNKEKYIRTALESIFMQETKYSYEIIVADDCSSDHSLVIIQEFQKKYPEKIKILYSEKNQGLYKNIIRAYEITKSDYFCVLDPDDYWISKHKRENALNFLANHPDFTIYSSDILMKYESNKEQQCKFSDKEINSDFKDYLKRQAVISFTQGCIYRNIIFKEGLPDKMKNVTDEEQACYRGDSFRNLIHIHKGKAHYSPELEAVYRITDEGIWTSTTKLEQNILNCLFFKNAWLFYDKKYPELLYISKNLFTSFEQNIIDELNKIQDKNKVLKSISTIVNLKNFYDDNCQMLDKIFYKNIRFKNKILLFIYETVKQKLVRARLLNN